MNLKDEVRQLILKSKTANFAPYGHGTTDDWIKKAEKKLGIKLPPTYVWWLKNYGGGEINGEEIYSIYEIEDFQGGGDITYMRDVNLENEAGNANQLFISEPGQGESYYFCLNKQGEDGEMPVFVYDYANNAHSFYAGTFLEFLKKRLLTS